MRIHLLTPRAQRRDRFPCACVANGRPVPTLTGVCDAPRLGPKITPWGGGGGSGDEILKITPQKLTYSNMSYKYSPPRRSSDRRPERTLKSFERYSPKHCLRICHAPSAEFDQIWLKSCQRSLRMVQSWPNSLPKFGPLLTPFGHVLTTKVICWTSSVEILGCRMTSP